MSTSTEYMDGLNASVERRFYPRVTPPTPIYVAFGSNNLGVLHNVSENGFQVATPTELALNSVFRVSLSLNGAPKTIAVTVRTIWSDQASKRSGIQLLDLSDEDRQQIRKWIVFEMSRNENPNAWYFPKNGERRAVGQNPSQVNRHAVPDREAVSDAPANDAAVAAALVADAAPVSAPAPAAATPIAAPLASASMVAPAAERPITPPVVLPVAAAPILEQSRPATPAQHATPQYQDQAINSDRPASDQPAHAQSFAFYGTVAQPSATESATTPATALPPIANPFDDPGPNSPFQQFPSVPLPIHGEFEYAKRPPTRRRKSTANAWYSHLRTKPLILWAAMLAVVCFGANALVRYKIKHNAARFATESTKYTPPASDAAAPNSVDDSGASSSNAPSATDPSSAANGSVAGDPNVQSAPSKPSTVVAPATTAQNDPSSASNSVASRSAANDSPQAQVVTRRESSLDASESRAYTATAPPSSDRSEQVARTGQAAATPRTWSAPAPSRSSSAGVSPNDAPQSPNVGSSSNAVPAQSAPVPVVAQIRPTPPPPTVQASNNVSASAPPSSSNNTANNTLVRTQTPPPANSQPSTYASNANTTPSRSQSQIYNANAPAQRSAIIGSINSVHSSGIFESNDSTDAAQPTANSRGANANAPYPNGGNANASVATRPVASNSVVPTDTPQERDIEILAPKGFATSYVDLPGEHVVRAAGAIVHMRRSIRVPGERIPGQRWLWRGRLNVTLGDVVTRIDPAVVQASGASGSLTVQATIDKDGYVTDLKPLYGNFAMLPSVSRAVRNWRYEPTYLDSKRAETQAQIEFDLRPTTAANPPAHR
jgi:PilZ domain/Gram-negative bacterial TonB protein C-terminal